MRGFCDGCYEEVIMHKVERDQAMWIRPLFLVVRAILFGASKTDP